MINAIVAVNEDWGIGYNGNLLEHISEDLKHFKNLTNNHIIIMGRKTWDSLPKKPLPNRINLVITTQKREIAEGTVFLSMEEVQSRLGVAEPEDNIFIIGGGKIYTELLPLCDRVYITKIYKKHKNVDTYFPNLDALENEWRPSALSDRIPHEDFEYQFWVYDKIS